MVSTLLTSPEMHPLCAASMRLCSNSAEPSRNDWKTSRAVWKQDVSRAATRVKQSI
jgi:hypothetical protein